MNLLSNAKTLFVSLNLHLYLYKTAFGTHSKHAINKTNLLKEIGTNYTGSKERLNYVVGGMGGALRRGGGVIYNEHIQNTFLGVGLESSSRHLLMMMKICRFSQLDA